MYIVWGAWTLATITNNHHSSYSSTMYVGRFRRLYEGMHRVNKGVHSLHKYALSLL